MIQKLIGIIVMIIGLVLTVKPYIFSSKAMPADGYQRIESRVMWGIVIGIGVFITFHQYWTSWKITIFAFLTAIILGFIIARLIGFVLDGFFPKQLLFLGIEVIVFFVFAYFYWQQHKVI